MTRRTLIFATWVAIIAASTAIGSIVGYLVASHTPLAYTSEASLFIGPPLNSQINESDLNVGQLLRATYANLATTRPVLTRVITDTGLNLNVNDLKSEVSARVPPSSTLLVVSVTSGDPVQAAQIANADAAELVAYPKSLPSPTTGATTGANVAISIVNPAIPAKVAIDRHVLLAAAACGGVGLLLATGLSFLLENLRRERQSVRG